jgi:hypothetical protein
MGSDTIILLPQAEGSHTFSWLMTNGRDSRRPASRTTKAPESNSQLRSVGVYCTDLEIRNTKGGK